MVVVTEVMMVGFGGVWWPVELKVMGLVQKVMGMLILLVPR